MKIAAKSEYACLAMIELARAGSQGAPRRVREIAEAQRIPERYLVQILLQLKAAGFVQSARGSDGGYVLARAAHTISIAEVIQAIEGPSAGMRKGGSEASQRLSDLLERASDAQREVLRQASIQELADAPFPHDWVV